MGDADASYDFAEIPKFVEKLRQGYDLVQGCRLPSGGGTVMPGAMPWLHRWLGNPMFSLLARRMFRAKVHDVYCGMRAFTKTFYQRLDQRCTGMEFATEMIIKASLFGGSIAEVPITLHPDGRTAHLPHLKTFRDGWRTLRFFLICSPRWLFLIPGGALILLGLVGYGSGDAWTDYWRHHLRCAHTAVFESGDAVRLPGDTVRAALDDVCRHRAAAATGSAPRTPVQYRDARKGPGAVADRAGCGTFLLLGAVEQWRAVNFGDSGLSPRRCGGSFQARPWLCSAFKRCSRVSSSAFFACGASEPLTRPETKVRTLTPPPADDHCHTPMTLSKQAHSEPAEASLSKQRRPEDSFGKGWRAFRLDLVVFLCLLVLGAASLPIPFGGDQGLESADRTGDR